MNLVALWNADRKYFKTRHNAGAIVLAEILSRLEGQSLDFDKTFSKKFSLNKSLSTYEASSVLEGVPVNFFLPDTYMNLSGGPILKVVKKYNLYPKDLVVILDDKNLPVGKFIISVGEGASSHNGIKSLQESLKSNSFIRVRIGVAEVGPDGKAKKVEGEVMSDFVLSSLTDYELGIIRSLAGEILEKVIKMVK